MDVGLITLEGGGISTVCYGLASQLSKRRISATVLTETPGKRRLESTSEFMKIERLHTMEIPPRFAWFQLQNYRYLTDRLSKFDVIHGVYPDASTIVTFNKTKIKRPFIVTFHAEPLSNVRDFVKTPLSSWTIQDFGHQIVEFPMLSYNLKRCSEKADHITVCSYSALREFQAAYKNLDMNRVTVVHNAVNLKEIDNNSRNVSLPPTENRPLKIAFAGRLFWVKGLLHLLKALEIVSRDRKNIQLHVFGRGPEESKMKQFVTKTGLSNIVYFRGRIPNKELIGELKSSDIVVTPSMHEAQSMIVIEAMACGKPVIAFNIPSMREMITDGANGLLAKPFEHEDLSEKILQVIDNSKLRDVLGKNAQQYVKEHHNLEKQVSAYIDIYSRYIR
jgi:glycosyltransferase involved in cell wall biosynthesis